VQRKHVVAMGEVARKAQPVIAVGAESMDHQQSFTLRRAAFVVMYGQPVYLYLSWGEARLLTLDKLDAGDQSAGREIKCAGRTGQQQSDTQSDFSHDESLSLIIIRRTCYASMKRAEPLKACYLSRIPAVLPMQRMLSLKFL